MLERSFYKKLSSVAFPIMIQNLLSTSLSFLDTLMIGQLGSNQIAAVGVANQIFFLVNLFIFGIASGASIFLSQFYGAKRYDDSKKVLALGLTISLIISTVFAIISFFTPDIIMRIFTDVSGVVEVGATYQKYVSVSYIFFTISLIHSFGFRSIGNAKLPLAATTISLLINAIGNYLLIFGIGFFPKLGSQGAAIATTISRFIEMVIILCATYKLKVTFRIVSLKSFVWDRAFLATYFKTCLPVLCNEILWSLGITFYKIGYSLLGVDTLASINISEAIGNFFFVAALGIGNGSTVIIGQYIGGGKIEEAKKGARQALILTTFIGIIMGLFMALSAPLFTRLFNISKEIERITIYSLYVRALFEPIKTINILLIVGILRSGGDTRYSLFAETSCVWLIGVPAAFIAAGIFKAPIYIVLLFVHLEEIAKLLLSLPRFKSGKWIKLLAN